MGVASWFKKLFSASGYPEISEALEPAKPKAIDVGSTYPGGGDGSKWQFGMSASGVSPIFNHYILRQNARSAVQDSLQAKGLVERYADTVVNVGLKLDSSPRFRLLGISAEEAENWARNTEELFGLWARDKRASRAEDLTFYQMQRLAEIFQQRDNDYFVRFYYSPNKNLLNPLQLQFLDPNQIRGYAFTSTYGFQSLVDGIVRDEAGKEIAYKVWVRDKEDNYVERTIMSFGPKSKRRFMIHGFQPEYAGQGRGISRLAHALQEFENITDFTVSNIKKAIAQSSMVAFIENEENDSTNPFADMSSRYGGAGPAGMLGSNPIPPEGETATSLEEEIYFQNIPEATIRTPGSAIIGNLRKGDKFKQVENTAPAESYDKFVNAFVSYMSASMGMPIEVLLMKFGQNYSASRGALILFWQVALIWREELAADFLNPVYKNWLAGEIAAGRIQAPGWSDPRMQEAWLHCNWIGAAMPNIDPMRTAKADKEYIEMGAQTLDSVARNHNGSEGDLNRAKLARELQSLPVPPWAKGNSSSGAAGGVDVDEDNS